MGLDRAVAVALADRDPVGVAARIRQSLAPDGTWLLVDIKAPVSVAPVVANNTLYILDDSGRLTAFR